MEILTKRQIRQKVRRLAMEILERNFEEAEIVLLGINNNGYRFAEVLRSQLRETTGMRVTLSRIRLNPARPIADEVQVELTKEEMQGKVLIVVDDVANTGRTLFFAFLPLMHALPKKVEVAVLVDREHKSFPVSANYVGLSLATTLNEHIHVELDPKGMSVHLE
jgi:pyrimidine operon attenuation protein/uracil phosphoribosyltransferase